MKSSTQNMVPLDEAIKLEQLVPCEDIAGILADYLPTGEGWVKTIETHLGNRDILVLLDNDKAVYIKNSDYLKNLEEHRHKNALRKSIEQGAEWKKLNKVADLEKRFNTSHYVSTDNGTTGTVTLYQVFDGDRMLTSKILFVTSNEQTLAQYLQNQQR